MAKDSDVETFCALRLFIESWRWAGVPWYLRSGKCLPQSVFEILVELKPPPQQLFADSWPAGGSANYLRFRLAPDAAIALAARVKRAGEEFVGDQRELVLLDTQPNQEAPYERLLGDAIAGDGALFTREDSVEAAWDIVDPILTNHHRAHPYKPGSWGPEQADKLIAPDGRWHNPRRPPQHSNSRHAEHGRDIDGDRHGDQQGPKSAQPYGPRDRCLGERRFLVYDCDASRAN